MLDLFYVAVLIIFFVLMWGFTKAADRLWGGGSSGICHCRSHRNLPFYLSAVRAASSRTVL